MNTASVEDVPLHTAASERYLNYALSVITARALPDARASDGARGSPGEANPRGR